MQDETPLLFALNVKKCMRRNGLKLRSANTMRSIRCNTAIQDRGWRLNQSHFQSMAEVSFLLSGNTRKRASSSREGSNRNLEIFVLPVRQNHLIFTIPTNSWFSWESPSFSLNLLVSWNVFWVIFGGYSWTLTLLTFSHKVVSRFLSSRLHPESRWLFPFYFSNITLRTDLLTFGVTGAVFKIAGEMRWLPVYFDNPAHNGKNF